MWWKHPNVTPSSFGLALFCFILPWIDIRCDSLQGQGVDRIRTTQSGLEMCFGGSTTTVNDLPLTPAQQAQAKQQQGHRKLVVPAIWFYALALLVGLVASLTIQKPGRRFRYVCGAGLVAIVVMVVQLAIGFPIVEGVPRRQNSNGWSYTIWFWLGLAATSAAPLSAVAQRLADPRPAEDETEPPQEPLSPEARARRRQRIWKGITITFVSLLLTLAVLFIWPGWLRPLPRAGIAMSGYTQYMLSDEHLAQVKLGMTLQEVQEVLDIAQEKMKPEQYMNWDKDRLQVGQNNLKLIEMSVDFRAQHKEFWFDFSDSMVRTLSVRIKDGRVVEIKDSKDEEL